jgi:hypothetical protein
LLPKCFMLFIPFETIAFRYLDIFA